MNTIRGQRDRRRLLLINRDQFGHHTVTYKFAVGLRSEFDLTYVCWDYGRPRVEAEDINVIYVSRQGNKISRYLRFLRHAILVSREGGFDLAFFKYFPGASVVKLLGRGKTWVFDVRTGPISASVIHRRILGILLLMESLFFKNVSVISSSLSTRLGLANRNPHILPLGSDVISSSNKTWDELSLLYVGTLEYRSIDLTILGLSRFIASHPEHKIRRYTIIGAGPNHEEDQLRELVDKLGLADLVNVVGRVPHSELAPYFDSHNVGVAFVPITPYFDCQPPTKVYEYLLSGLAVLATRTQEMKDMLDGTSAILLDDSAEAFRDAVATLHSQRRSFDSNALRKLALDNTWTNIVDNNLIPYLKGLL